MQLGKELVAVVRDTVEGLQDLALCSRCCDSCLDLESWWEVVVEGRIRSMSGQADNPGKHWAELDLEAERQVVVELPKDVVAEVVAAQEEVQALDRLDPDLP